MKEIQGLEKQCSKIYEGYSRMLWTLNLLYQGIII